MRNRISWGQKSFFVIIWEIHIYLITKSKLISLTQLNENYNCGQIHQHFYSLDYINCSICECHTFFESFNTYTDLASIYLYIIFRERDIEEITIIHFKDENIPSNNIKR